MTPKQETGCHNGEFTSGSPAQVAQAHEGDQASGYSKLKAQAKRHRAEEPQTVGTEDLLLSDPGHHVKGQVRSSLSFQTQRNFYCDRSLVSAIARRAINTS